MRLLNALFSSATPMKHIHVGPDGCKVGLGTVDHEENSGAASSRRDIRDGSVFRSDH